jgi:hypothetical protein
MEVYLAAECRIDQRVIDRMAFEKLFSPLVKRVLPMSYNPEGELVPDPLLQFFQTVGWTEIANEFVASYEKMRQIASGSSVIDDRNTQVLKYTSWKWDVGPKSKNAPREYSPILGSVLFERYYSDIYRFDLLLKSPAGRLRAQLNWVLNSSVKTIKQIDRLTGKTNIVSEYVWWDQMSVDPQDEIIPGSAEDNYGDVIKSKKIWQAVNRLTAQIQAMEKNAMSEFCKDHKSQPLVPNEVAYALDILVRVSSYLYPFLHQLIAPTHNIGKRNLLSSSIQA